MECALVNSQIREIFHKWDCSLIESEELFAELISLGLRICETFTVLIENHKRIRNLPFSVFLKALKLGQMPKPANERPGSSSGVSTSRLMNAVIFRDAPVSSSAKAPFGTDNNMFLRPPQSPDPLTAEFMCSAFPVERKRMGPVAGSSNVFKETIANEEEDESVISDLIPRHLKSSLNPITGEPFIGMEDDCQSHCSTIKRKAMEDHGDIFTWCSSPEEDCIDQLPVNRRHYPVPPVVSSEEPIQEPPEEAFVYARNFTRESPISHHSGDTSRNGHRRLVKSVSTKPESFCPFATDIDDLETMRKLIRQKPLGTVFAPSPTTAR